MAETLNLGALDALHDWMRAHGVKRAKFGDVELELGGPVPPGKEAPPMTPEQIQLARREAKRAKYSVELGMQISDKMLERLP